MTPRPAALSSVCDCYSRNPDPNGPYLVRCRKQAKRRLTLQTPGDCSQVKRCEAHADELQAKVTRGATFEILEDEVIE